MSDPVEELMNEWFMEAHPHEAYEMDPERFWKFFQTKRPGVSREMMERVLKGTASLPTKSPARQSTKSKASPE